MKKINYYLFLVIILVFGCGEDNVNAIPNIEEGKFKLKLYSSSGKLLLTKNGDAESIGTFDGYWEIRLLDPSLETFASLTMLGESSKSEPQKLQIENENSAFFRQRWYSMTDDWGYKSVNGTLKITSVENHSVKGSFEINLEVDENAQQNPSWGEHIVAKGYFSSICPYEQFGGCP